MNAAPTVAAAAERYLRRLFPKRHVRVQTADFGVLVEVGFLTEDDVGVSRWRTTTTTASTLETSHGLRAVAAKLLRTAYPRGWAVP